MAWWVTLYPRYRDHRDARTWADFLAEVLDAARTRGLDLDPTRLASRLRALEPGSHLAAFATVLSSYADERQRPRWGDKTLLAEFYADDILASLPGARVIHLLRDPRDVFASYRHAPWRLAPADPRTRASVWLRGHMAWTIRNWRASARLARINAARHPGRYLVLRYEDLVRAPRAELERVCAFLGEPFDPAMLEMRAYPDYLDRRSNSSFDRLDGISTAPVGRFRAVLDTREIALCEALAGADLARWGYAAAGVSLGASGALRLHAVDRPWSALIGLVHAGAFRAQGIPRA
jgi:hypothetical protein